MTLHGPILALVALTFLVWLRLFHLRIGEMRRSRIRAQRLALSAPKYDLLQDSRASDNFANLFELPVLFYLGALIAMQAGIVDPILLGLAWAYVGLRAAHSLIHCSYNRVMHRFSAYMLSSLVLAAFWLRLAFELPW